jgi:hypothetical protein
MYRGLSASAGTELLRIFVVASLLLLPVLANADVGNPISTTQSGNCGGFCSTALELGNGYTGAVSSVDVDVDMVTNATLANNSFPSINLAFWTNSNLSGHIKSCTFYFGGDSTNSGGIPAGTYNGVMRLDYDAAVSGAAGPCTIPSSAAYLEFDIDYAPTNGVVPTASVYGDASNSASFAYDRNLGQQSYGLSGLTPSGVGYFVIHGINNSSSNCDTVLGEIATSTTWSAGVHCLTGIVTIDSGATLTIDPGTIIKFDTATTSGIVVNGTLNAEGDFSTDDEVVFTSLKDDLFGADTNGDGTSTTPASGDWAGITVNPGGTAQLDYSVIRYGGSAGGSNAMIFNNGGTTTIDSRSTVAYGSDYGVRNSAGTTTISNSDIGYNNYGLYVDGGSVGIEATSTIHNNSTYGVYNTTNSYISAENNYWGDSSGPYNASGNPTGLGNSVSDYVDYYPWIGTSTLHYVDPTITSVTGQQLTYTASTTYSGELVNTISTWNALNKINLLSATTTPDVTIQDEDRSDLSEKGHYDYIAHEIDLNTYFLNSQGTDLIQNTITHELGHALGLDHSYTGNVMYFAQSTQTTLGPQDVSDYNYLWP